MESKKIKLVIQNPSKNWNGKELRKRTVVFEDDTNGELTLFPEDKDVEAGQTIEYEMQDRGYGNEIKMKKSGASGGGGGRPSRTPHDLAMLNTNAIIKSLIESQQVKLDSWQKEYTSAYKFFIDFEENIKTGMPF